MRIQCCFIPDGQLDMQHIIQITGSRNINFIHRGIQHFLGLQDDFRKIFRFHFRRHFFGKCIAGNPGGLHKRHIFSFRQPCRLQIHGHIFFRRFPADELPDGKRDLAALNRLSIRSYDFHKEGRLTRFFLIGYPLAASCAVKASFYGIAVKQIRRRINPISLQILERNIYQGRITPDTGGFHLHPDSVIFTGFPDRNKKLCRSG